MKTRTFKRGIGVFASSMLVVGLGVAPAFADNIYNDIAVGDYNGGPETTSYASAANGINSFGSVISPDNTGVFNNVTLMMSNYATSAMYPGNPGGGYNVNMDLQVYQITGAGSGATPDTLYTSGVDYGAPVYDSGTQSFTINYRPPADDPNVTPGACGGGNSNAYLVSANTWSCGQLNALDFSMNGVLTQGTSYLWVATILGSSDSPSQSLNWAINNLTSNISPTSNPQFDTNYVGVDGSVVGGAGWASIGQGEIAFTPEPATLGLIGLGLLGVGFSVRRKSKKN